MKGLHLGKWLLPLMVITILFFGMLISETTASAGIVRSGICGWNNGSNLTWTLDDAGKLTISGTGRMQNYTTDYSNPWGMDLKSVEIQDGVTNIGKDAFSRCRNLTNITLPESLTSIDENAFYGCGSLTNITIPDSVTSIGSSAFDGCISLTDIRIPHGVTRLIGTFASCTRLTSITIPDSVTRIDGHAFYHCTGLTSIMIPDSVTSIGNGVFSECTGLTSITIPDSVTSIGDNAFYNCTGLTSITLPDGLTSIGYSTFENCTSLLSITIPNGVTSIGRKAFYNCTGLTSITIPDSVTSIVDNTFSKCTGLTNVTIPDSVTSIGRGAFDSCIGLTSITLPAGLTHISGYAFYNCTGLMSIMLPKALRNIDYDAFNGCSKLKSITIPEGVWSISMRAFKNCTGLMSITLPNSLMSISESAFSEDNAMRVFIPDISITFPSNVFPSGSTIYCYEYTDVDVWARQQGYNVVNVDSPGYEPDADRTVTIGIASLAIAVGHSASIPYDVFPRFDDPALSWSSSAPEVAAVEDGVVTALSTGYATITLTAGGASQNIEIWVYTPLEDFAVSEGWVVARDGISVQIVDAVPEGGTASFTWTSSDEMIALTDGSTGNSTWVTTYKPGDVTITAATDTGISRSAVLHVCYPVTAAVFERAEMIVQEGAAAQLTCNVTMRTQSCVNHLVTFTSSDESVAAVDGNGRIEARFPGAAIITATASSGVTAECTVIVTEQNLDTLCMPTSLTAIGDEAFAGISAEMVVIPYGVASIGDRAFAECTRLARVYVPTTVTSIGEGAFDGCEALTLVCVGCNTGYDYAVEHNIPYIVIDPN